MALLNFWEATVEMGICHIREEKEEKQKIALGWLHKPPSWQDPSLLFDSSGMGEEEKTKREFSLLGNYKGFEKTYMYM